MISAKVIAHSASPYSDVRPVVTMQVTMHRFVLAEFNTHRMFSRNFRSSRAVPVHKLLAEVRESPALPVTWQANKPGMQGGEELTGDDLIGVQSVWKHAALNAAERAEDLMRLGLHKSWANRLLEPYLYVHGVVTATDWSNFFALRRHPDAQPEIKHLADLMWEAQQASTPKVLRHGEWHLPFVTEDEMASVRRATIRALPKVHNPLEQIKLSVARCARVSYLTHDGKTPSVEDDLALYERLVGAAPLHASPAEHQCTPDMRTLMARGYPESYNVEEWDSPELHGNLTGFVQHRKTLPNECL